MSPTPGSLFDLLLLMLPAYLANMSPPFLRFWRGWNPPISARLLGEHKTVLGFAVGVATAVLTSAVQAHVLPSHLLRDPSRWLLAGLALGVGAMGGDCLKSLFKRRLAIPPGARWVPFDQLDFAIGALLLSAPLTHLRWLDVLTLLVVTLAGDLAVNRVAYRLRLKDTPW